MLYCFYLRTSVAFFIKIIVIVNIFVSRNCQKRSIICTKLFHIFAVEETSKISIQRRIPLGQWLMDCLSHFSVYVNHRFYF